jgi:uncharacterized membrane protein
MPIVGIIAVLVIASLFAIGIWKDFIRPRK